MAASNFHLRSVRREDLLSRSTSSSPSSSPDPELAAAYHARLESIYGPANVHGGYTEGVKPIVKSSDEGQARGEREDEEEHEEFAFRLFGGEDERRIVIREEDQGPGAFLRGGDLRVFIIDKAQGERREEIESMAVSGEEVLRRRGERAWGFEVPWRVVVVREARRRGKKEPCEDRDGLERGDGDEKRKRMGKKKRIASRVKTRREEEEREKREREEKEKEERRKEKRVRRNKEKKVKRKMKEKAEKAKKSGVGEGGTVEGSVTADPPLSVGEGQGD